MWKLKNNPKTACSKSALSIGQYEKGKYLLVDTFMSKIEKVSMELEIMPILTYVK